MADKINGLPSCSYRPFSEATTNIAMEMKTQPPTSIQSVGISPRTSAAMRKFMGISEALSRDALAAVVSWMPRLKQDAPAKANKPTASKGAMWSYGILAS